MIYGSQILTQQVVQDKVDIKNSDLKGIAKSFYNHLEDLMFDFANPYKDMSINGVTIAAKDKFGFAATLLMNQELNQSNQVIKFVFDMKSAEMTNDKLIDSIRSST